MSGRTLTSVSKTRSVRPLLPRVASFLVAIVALSGAWATPSYASGTSWTVATLPIASGYWGTAEAISCPAPGDCVTVGTQVGPETGTNDGSVAAAASVEHAGSWSAFAAVTAGAVAQQGALESVSCWAAGRCIAVGIAPHGIPNSVPHVIAYELNGSNWTALTPPMLPAPIFPVSVSCVDPGTCRVMGPVSRSPRGATVRAYVATFAADTWSVTNFLVPPNTLDFDSITCSSTTICAALLDTGSVVRGASTVQRSYLDWMRAGTWRRTMPQGWSTIDVVGLSCPSPTTCAAAARERSGDSVLSRQALGWALDVVPDGNGAGTPTCVSSTCEMPYSPPFCGDACGHGPSQSGGVLTLAGDSWSAAVIATPPGLLNTQPRALACDSVQCTVAGDGQVEAPNEGDAYYLLPFVATSGPI